VTTALTDNTTTPAAPEAKPAPAAPAAPEAKPADAADAAPEAKPADAAPAAEIEYKVSTPEGVELAAADTEALVAIAREAKIAPEAVQKIADIAARREQARAAEFEAQVQAWGDAVKADKELGDAAALASATKVVDTYGNPEFKALLAESGLGNHPEMVRFVQKIAKAVSEDAIRAGSTRAGATRDAASVLYGTPNT
jgi:hypothetical protein